MKDKKNANKPPKNIYFRDLDTLSHKYNSDMKIENNINNEESLLGLVKALCYLSNEARKLGLKELEEGLQDCVNIVYDLVN